MEDLVERIIYAVITVNAYQKKSKTGDFLEEPETQGNSFQGKVHTFSEGHKILRNLQRRFDCYYIGKI